MFSLIDQKTSINQFPNLIQQSLNKVEDTKPNSISSNDSTQEPNPKRLNYILEDTKKSYSVHLILYEEKIKIKVYPLPEGNCDYFYEREFSQEELIKKVNNAFKLCTDIEDSFKYFEELFTDKEKKFSIKEEKDIFINSDNSEENDAISKISKSKINSHNNSFGGLISENSLQKSY